MANTFENIKESQIDDVVHGAADKLVEHGLHLSDEQYDELNDLVTGFLQGIGVEAVPD